MTADPRPLAYLPDNPLLTPWLQQMAGANYVNRRRMAWRMRPKLSRFLYRYHGFRGEFSLQSLRDAIVHSQLRLSPPSSFNDPFDMSGRFVLHGTVAERKAKFKDMSSQFHKKPSWKEYDRALHQFLHTPDHVHEAKCQASMEQIRATAGVCCFAGKPETTLMWSHYADYHKGVCLQYERVQDFPTFCHAMPVKYRKEFPTVNWIVDFKKGIESLLFSKDPCWEYEHESRILAHNHAGHYLPFRPEALRSVILGCNADKTGFDAIQNLLEERKTAGHPPLRLYRASKHKSEYKLVVRRT